MLEAARLHGIDPNARASEAKADLQIRLGIEPIELDPRVFFRITDNWLELTVRFIAATHQIRGVKDAMSRHIIAGLDKAGIGIASATYDIVGFPAVELRASQSSPNRSRHCPFWREGSERRQYLGTVTDKADLAF